MKANSVTDLVDFPVERVKSYWLIGKSDNNFSEGSLLFAAPVGFIHFSGIQALTAKLKDRNATVVNRLATEYAETLLITCPNLFEGDAINSISLEFPTIQAITRRISRETTHIARHIDETAIFLAKCLVTMQVVQLICTNADDIDAASMRVMVRLYAFAEKNDLSVTYCFRNNPLDKILFENDYQNRVENARYHLFRAAASRMSPELKILHEAPGMHKSIAKSYDGATAINQCQIFNSCQSQITIALAYQTYDRAYILCDHALALCQTGDQLAETLRLMALIDVNLGEIKSALETLHVALDAAKKPSLLAHLHYLCGLITAKRTYDLQAAESNFHFGLRILDDNLPDTDEGLIERAWLYNGLALLLSLKAKQEPGEIQKSILEEALHYEMQALKLIQPNETAQAIYLRFNLLANSAFLFEIMRRYEEAVTFWERAFLPYLKNNEGLERLKFQKTLCYRVGMLYHRAGYSDRALLFLNESIRACEESRDCHALCRALYGTAIVQLESGDMKNACVNFERGVKLARKVHDWESCRDHLLGLAHIYSKLNEVSIDQSNINYAIEQICQLFDKANGLGSGESWKRIGQNSFKPPRPSPKLPAYNPLVDLAAIPKTDLNRYLESPDSIY